MPLKNKKARLEYHKKYMRERYANDTEFRKRQLARNRKNNLKYAQQVKQVISDWKSHGCKLCEEKEECCMSAHHTDASLKKFNIGTASGNKTSVSRAKAELEKCVCLCENCHRKLHAGLITL